MTNESWHQNVSLPALLRHARGTYGRAMRAALMHAGYENIPANGLYIIGGLAQGAEGFPIGQLVKELGITKQGGGQLVDTLVTKGYLARTPDENDRRQLIVTLTERGRAAAAVQLAARQQIDAALLAAIGSNDLDSTRRTLAALIDIGRQSVNSPDNAF
jgi:DNA-binding MarR family transcriptional regulator